MHTAEEASRQGYLGGQSQVSSTEHTEMTFLGGPSSAFLPAKISLQMQATETSCCGTLQARGGKSGMPLLQAFPAAKTLAYTSASFVCEAGPH